jgi:hypothetical protein
MLYLPDFSQFPVIEPVSGAIRTMVYFHLTGAAEQVPLELNPGATRTLTLAGRVQLEVRVAANLQKMFTGGFVLFIHLFQFKSVEPHPATAALANIHRN